MAKKFLLSYVLLFSSAALSGFVVMYNWCSRHPFLVFFESKFALYARYTAAIFGFYLIFKGFQKIIDELTPKAKSSAKRLYYHLDHIVNLSLGPLLLKRYFIPGRHEGNRYYLFIFVSWIAIKVVLFALLFDKSTLKALPSTLKILALKIRTWFARAFAPQEYRLSYFGFILLYLIVLQGVFFRGFPKVTWLVPLSYTLLFFSALLFIASCIRAYFSEKIFSILLYSMTLLCVFATIDFFCYELMNLHFKESVSSIFADGWSQVPKVLEGADLNPSLFGFLCALGFLFPLIAVWLYPRLPSEKVSFSCLLPLVLGSSLLGTTYLSDRFVQKKLLPSESQSFIQTCPIKPLFLKSQGERLTFSKKLAPPPTEESLKEALLKDQTLKQSPHVFLFVIESFRDDYIDEKTAPFLYQLKKSSPKFELTASNANVTHISLFSIYTGLFPHHWNTLKQQDYQMGSYPLALLKKSGYELHALHSSFFKYFGIGEVLFGKDHYLLDTLYEAKHLSSDVAQRDQMTLDQAIDLTHKMDRSKPHFVTLLLDSTHHHYYWPEGLEVPHSPYLQSFNYTNMGKGQLELTKNRYRNSIYYVDRLVQAFCDHLKKEGLYEDSLILITGDHGEEFMEYGHYFHGTDLCLPQSHVPMIYKFPKGFDLPIKQTLTSHVDFFPTLFDLLGLKYTESELHGTSLFSEKTSYILSFRPQYKKSPYQFYLHNGKEKIEGKLLNSEEIYKSQGIELTAMKDLHENILPMKDADQCKDQIFSLFDAPLKQLFRD